MKRKRKTCNVIGCNEPHRARGWCKRHYDEWYSQQQHGRDSRRKANRRHYSRNREAICAKQRQFYRDNDQYRERCVERARRQRLERKLAIVQRILAALRTP